MKITIGLLLITFQTVFGGVPSVQHIINGTDVAPGEAPYMAGLRRNDEDIYCGGALISNKHVLTIAHCADGYKTNNITVLLGTNDLLNGGQYYTIENISVSSDYNEKNSVGIAVLTLTREVEFSNVLDKISLPAMDAPDDGSSVLTGYGYQKKDKENGHMSQILQKLQVNIFNQSNCAKILQQHEILQPQHLCGFTGTSYGACYGDSGSPLIYNNTLIGLALSVYPDCAEGNPDVYARVMSYLNFIKQIIS